MILEYLFSEKLSSRIITRCYIKRSTDFALIVQTQNFWDPHEVGSLKIYSHPPGILVDYLWPDNLSLDIKWLSPDRAI